MKFHPLAISGAYLIELEAIRDARGFNARAWCAREFAKHGLTDRFVQTNVIVNNVKGTLRGLHWQAAPMGESKLFRVTRGAIYDVVLDLRPGSRTFKDWASVELRADCYTLLYVPAGCAQGFQTLEDETELIYQVSAFYSPQHGRGIRYDDPAFAIHWPIEVTVISGKDLAWPDFQLEEINT